MAMEAAAEKYIPKDNTFYRKYYAHFFYALMGVVVVLLAAVAFVLYQLANRPEPEFYARLATGEGMTLESFDAPNLLPQTITRFASKAAVTALTFDFVNYEAQINKARPFFTDAGWTVFRSSVSGLINTVVQGQLFVSGVVVGQPVISNEGEVPDRGYVWRVQVPFIVTYQSANTTYEKRYFIIVSMVKVPTSQNPQGIGIDQFMMR